MTAQPDGRSRKPRKRANRGEDRRVVVLTGQLADPRPAYSAADVILGMGSSALRGMAFGKPLVVQGERGFWELLTPDSASVFLRDGWYGVACAHPTNEHEGRSINCGRYSKELLDNPDRHHPAR